MSVTDLTAQVMISAIQMWHDQNQHDTRKVFDMDLFKFTAICDVQPIFCSYPRDDTDTVTFVLMAVLTTVVSVVLGISIKTGRC